MCKVYNQIGCLRQIKSHLTAHNINEFNSIKELIEFKKNYFVRQQQIISDHSKAIEQEKISLHSEIGRLKELIEIKKIGIGQRIENSRNKLRQQISDLPSGQLNFLNRCYVYFSRQFLTNKCSISNACLHRKARKEERRDIDVIDKLERRFHLLDSNFTEFVQESCVPHLQQLEKKRRIVEELTPSIFGALGEQKVVRELEQLPDEYILINDFTCSFRPPIYWRQEDDHIMSVQVDHLLLSPAGIFIIETKNWSRGSVNNESLRSPIQQIRRTGFALFKMLARNRGEFDLLRDQHHWGDRKIPIRNLIVMINEKPNGEFQYVKVLSLKELVGYVKYFKPVFSRQEIQMMADYLLRFPR